MGSYVSEPGDVSPADGDGDVAMEDVIGDKRNVHKQEDLDELAEYKLDDYDDEEEVDDDETGAKGLRKVQFGMKTC